MADKIVTANRAHPEPVKPLSEDIEKFNEFVNKRVDSMKVGSTVYKYYVNTPLHELKSREEKAIKREISRRQLEVLNEAEEDYGPANRVTPPTAGTGANEISNIKPDVDGSTISKTSEAPMGGDPDPIAPKGLFDQIMEFITSIPKTFSSFFAEGSALHNAYNSIVNYVQGLASKVMGSDVPKETVETGLQYSFATAAAILGLVAAWKLIKKFIGKDGTIETVNPADASVAASEAIEIFNKDNESIATLSLCNEDADPTSATNNMSTYIKKHADRMLADLLNDEQFVKYMQKNNPKLLDSLKSYKKVDAPVSEGKVSDVTKDVSPLSESIVNFEPINESHYDILLEDSLGLFGHFMVWLSNVTGMSMTGIEQEVKAIEQAKAEQAGVTDQQKAAEMAKKMATAASSLNDKVSIIGNKIYDAFDATVNKVSGTVKDAAEFVKGKMKTVGNQVETSNADQSAKMAGYGALLILALASIWYFYKKHKKNNGAPNKAVLATESNMLYLDKLSSIYSILEEKAPTKVPEAEKKVSKTDIKKDTDFPTIRGKDTTLIHNLCSRAKFVSASLITDKEFVSFAKKVNPEALSYMKAINKSMEKEEGKK
jgi:hypothetical protein|nr:MAG TPA: hypothetical protein [Caudoviricetes sp.]